MDRTTDFLTRLEEFIEDAEGEHSRTQQELREIDLLIRQSTAEVERLAQRNSQIKSKLTQMEGEIDNYTRAEIRSLYTAERESQLRLFMMRSEVDKLQNRQKTLEKYAQEAQRFLDLSRMLPEKDELSMEARPAPERKGAGGAMSMSRVIEAQEDERLALARQMHDGPAQSLTNLILHAEICERLFDSDASRARQELGNLRSFANSTFQKVRDFIFELRPMMLDDLGLSPTLRRYITSFEEKNRGTVVHFQAIGQERRLPATSEITLFRATQELLNNAIRHAHATHIQVSLDLSGEEALLSVEDNGSGFDVNELMSSGRSTRSVGLAAMRDRVEMLGGDITFDSAMGRGTRVALSLPPSEVSETPLLA